MKLLILNCGGSPDPLIYSIKKNDANTVYFLHSIQTEIVAKQISEKLNLKNSRYKKINDHQDIDDAYIKSKEIFSEVRDEFNEIVVDITGGTKTMVSGLTLAAIDEKCELIYVAAKDNSGRDKDGVGNVKKDFEIVKTLKNPYEIYAVKEFEKARYFFNKYQFEAAEKNLDEALKKLSDEKLICLAKIYIEIMKLYSNWDKFNNSTEDDFDLNKKLFYILNKINESDYLKTHFSNNHPYFIPKIKDNIDFLRLKISGKGKMDYKNVKYYLPDLLNNASRRIDEGKYDDAVARLYRSIELIAQLKLSEEKLIFRSSLNSQSRFFIDMKKIDSIKDDNIEKTLKTFPEYNDAKENGENKFHIASNKSFRLLSSMNYKLATDYLEDDDISRNVSLRNYSILAHGLNPIIKHNAEGLYEQTYKYAKLSFPEIDEYMEMSKFPLFQ